MKIDKKVDSNRMKISLDGRLDANTYQDLEKELDLDGIEYLELDLNKLEYVSSAGLRLILSCHKKMSEQGKMVVKNVKGDVEDVFDITGFADMLNIE